MAYHTPQGFSKVNGEWERTPVVPLRSCEFDKARRRLLLASEICGMPSMLYVESHHTGRVIRFIPVGPEDKLFDPDQWDGEQQIYRPVGGEAVSNVDYLVIYHQY